MSDEKQQRKDESLATLKKLGLLTDESSIRIMAGDGSERLFIRISGAERPSRIAVIPAMSETGANLTEARSTHLIGRHLRQKQVPVPEIFFFDEQTGVIVFEDLGGILLHDLVNQTMRDKGGLTSEIKDLYQQTIEVLVHLQVSGGAGFDVGWCWDTPRYDQQLMLTKESGYFLKACCQDLLKIQPEGPELATEFIRLADRAAQEPAGTFLHRDFQSRNLMVKEGQIRVIDFQGGRLGPLAYDLASLLIDPYAGLPEDFKNELLEYYLNILARSTSVDRRAFINGYYSLALQRNLQILGAFAFLSEHRGKTFFRAFLEPATRSLKEHLAKPEGADYPCLRKLATECLVRLTQKQ